MSSPIRRRPERRALRLWPVGLALSLTFFAALVIAAAVFVAGWDLLGARELKPERRLDSKTLFDLVKLSFGVVAGAGALVALVVAYRRQRVDEDGALREATRLHTERFTTAVAQLGDDSVAVRLGGVHALAGLADDAPTDPLRQTCIDVLCAYLRLPYTAEADLPPADTAARHAYLALREVRHTVIRLIRDRTAVDPRESHVSWQGYDLDFTGVVFDGGDFFGAVFAAGSTVSFRNARFCDATVDFRAAWFRGATVHFTDAAFYGATVDFRGAAFSDGTVNFFDAQFSDGEVSFVDARFAGAVVDFSDAAFCGATVNFRSAEFSDGMVGFRGAAFSGGTVNFSNTVFSDGRVELVDAAFSGAEVDFSNARFAGGTVHFIGAAFSGGTVDFAAAQFSNGGMVTFTAAHFRGGLVDIASALGRAPVDLLPPPGQPLPPGLRVPQRWRSPAP
ncbi:pentapeptide repeat-containing protein [Streptomyces sp. NPDC004732]|uniref:pentapeptide repeat-containing protein n=1 Tax=Streptomyces sp. NPDC004732 TaxID=3154290 RepID=UPI0033B1292C